MRLLKSVLAAVSVVLLSFSIAVSASAATHMTRKPQCVVPSGDKSFSDPTVVITEAPGATATPFSEKTPNLYSYCLRSTGRSHVFSDDESPGTDAASVAAFKLSGNYVAYVVRLSSGTVPPGTPDAEETNVADAATGKTSVVNTTAAAPSGEIAAGVANLALSSEGLFAETMGTYAGDDDGTEVKQSVLAFQASNGQTTVVGSGAPNTLANLRIFECAAGCSSTAPAVVEWTSNGTSEYGSV